MLSDNPLPNGKPKINWCETSRIRKPQSSNPIATLEQRLIALLISVYTIQ